MQFVGVLFGSLTFGSTADVHGRKPVAIVAVSLAMVATFLTGAASPWLLEFEAFVPSWEVLLLVRFVVGFGVGGTMTACLALYSELILPQHRMVMRGFFHMVWSEEGEFPGSSLCNFHSALLFFSAVAHGQHCLGHYLYIPLSCDRFHPPRVANLAPSSGLKKLM